MIPRGYAGAGEKAMVGNSGIGQHLWRADPVLTAHAQFLVLASAESGERRRTRSGSRRHGMVDISLARRTEYFCWQTRSL